MKTKIALLAVAAAFAFAAVPSQAQARPGDFAKAKKLTNEVVGHILNMATILDKNVNTPDKAITELTAYFANKKRMKRFTVIGKQMQALSLTDADKAALKKWVKAKKFEQRVKKSAMAFIAKNPQAVSKLMPIFMKLKHLAPK